MADAGADLIKQAEKKLKQNKFFAFLSGGGNKYEDAAELYARAAAKYKQCKNWAKTGECFQKAADILYQNTDEKIDAVTNWKEAAKAYKKLLDESDYGKKARNCYANAIQFYKEDNNYSSAAKLYEEIAKICLDEKKNKRRY